MGDRVSVRLTVLASQAEKAESLFEFPSDEGADTSDPLLTKFQFHGVDHGTLDFLNLLRDAGIAFDSTWEAGYSWEEGTAYCRYNSDSECIEKDIFDSSLNPDMSELLKRIDTPAELRQYILNHQEKTSVIDWDNQEEFGKIFQAKKLILS